MSKNMFCGCDVALENNTVWLMLDDGSQPTKLFGIENNQLGAEVLVERIYNIAKEHCVSDILIGTEATSMYDWHLLEYLSESKLALEFTLKLYRFNAKWIKESSEKSFLTQIYANLTQDLRRFSDETSATICVQSARICVQEGVFQETSQKLQKEPYAKRKNRPD